MKLFSFRPTAFGLILILLLAWICVPAPALALGNGKLPGSAAASFLGDAVWDRAGSSVAGVGDVNGDGYDDILIGAWGNNGNTGAAYLMLGGRGGLSLSKSLEQTPLIKYSGEAAGDSAGFSVAGAGDVNGDGYDDMLIGAYLNDGNKGAAYLVLGSSAPASANLSTAIKYSGEAAGDTAGRSVAGAGDVNGDGYDDLLIGATGYSYPFASYAGALYLVLGAPAPASANLSTAIKYAGEAGSNFAGWSVAGAGDVDGDGYDDVLVGARGNDSSTGAAYLVLGSAAPVGLNLYTAIKFSGEAAGDQAGGSVAGAGDVNGDGYPDMLIGAHANNGNIGAAYLVLGGPAPAGANLSTAIKYSGEAAGDQAGWSAAGAGDVNGDNYADMLVGAPNKAADTGAVYLILGGPVPASANLSLAISYAGDASNDLAGDRVAAAGDVNGDGYTDILVGAYGKNAYVGAAYLILSDGLTSSNPSYRQRQQLGPGANLPAVDFEQAGVRVDFTSGALTGADISVTRHIFHPCSTDRRLAMPIWTIESGKMNGTSSPVSLRFKYNSDQIAGMTEANLKLWSRPSGQPCGPWREVVGAAVDVDHNFVVINSYRGLGQFTIAETAPTPTALTDLSLIGQVAQSPQSLSLTLLAALTLAGGTLHFLRRRPEMLADDLVEDPVTTLRYENERLRRIIVDLVERQSENSSKAD